MEPHWLMVVSWIALALGFGSALVIVVDEFLLGHRQHMAVMNLVHPITALYWGPVWLWAYFRTGRKSSHKVMREQAMRFGGDVEELKRKGESTDPENLRPWHVGNAVSHCGAGCTLGDIAGEWIVFATGWTIAGATLWPELILDFPLAWTFGIVFQYFTIVPMRENIGRLEGLWLAIRADTLSIVAFQVGLFGWMTIVMLVIWPHHGIRIDSPDFWFQMQIGMILGYFTAWPVNRWLVSNGIKETMGHD